MSPPSAPRSPPTPDRSLVNPPHLTTAISNAPSLIYSYQNQQELFPQDSRVSLYVNATGNAVPTYANVQVVFVVESTLYDGVYDPSVADPGVGNPCNGPCQESDAVPYFVANAGRIASNIASNNAYSTVSFAMVDYFATLTDHDDGDGAEYHVDVGNFLPASQFQNAVVSGFQNAVLGGGWYYGDSDFSDNILGSSSTTALYGALRGSNLAWNPSYHHVIVWVGSTAPRDANYSVNYAGTHSDYNSGSSSACEPSYNYGGGLVSPNCEAWTTGTNNIAALARSLGVNIDVLDVANGMTDASSQDYTSGSYGTADSSAILHAGCDLAKATGGSWEGPGGYGCSAASTGTGQGNLSCTSGLSCFQGQSGGAYANPPRAWSSNAPLGWAMGHISFGPTSVSNVTATSNGQPMFQFVPQLNITPDPTNASWRVVCLRNGVPMTGCQQTPSVASSGSATIYGWNWPAAQMLLNDTWKATFNVVAVGAPYNVSYPLDACTATGCQGPVGNGAFSQVNYKNYQSTPTVTSFPPSDIYVVYPGMTVSVSPPYSRASVGFSATFTVSVAGGQPPYTYQWDINGLGQAGATSTTFTYTFSTTGTFIVRCLVWDSYGKSASGTAQVVILPGSGSLFSLRGNVTDAQTFTAIPGASVALNGTWGSTYTGGSGQYVLSALPNGTYTLFVNSTGYHPFAVGVRISGNTWVNVALTPQPPPSFTLSGWVLDFASGAAISGAQLALTFQGLSYGSATSNAQGAYAIPGVLNATYLLSASASGYYPSSLSVTIAGAPVVQNVSLRPLPPLTYYVGGTVEDNATHAPIPGALVALNASLYTNTTDVNGVYLLTGIPNGSYRFSVMAAGYTSYAQALLVGGASWTINVFLARLGPPPTATYSIAGTVLDASTLLPVPQATVVVYDGSGNRIATAPASPSGDYAVSGLTNGTFDAVVGAPGYSNASVGFTIAGLSLAQNFYLTAIPTNRITYYAVQGVVLDAVSGLAIPSATVTVSPLVGTVTSGPSGAFLFSQVANGTYVLSASKAGYAPANLSFQVQGTAVSRDISLTPSGVQDFAVSGIVLRVDTQGAVAGATVTVLNATSPPVTPVVTGSSGGFTLQAPRGHLLLRADAPGYRSGFLNVTVSGQALNGLVIDLTPLSTSGSSGGGGSFSWTSPGWGGLYLQLWLPAVGALVGFVIAFVAIKRRHRGRLPPPADGMTDMTAPPGATSAGVPGTGSG